MDLTRLTQMGCRRKTETFCIMKLCASNLKFKESGFDQYIILKNIPYYIKWIIVI